MKKRKKQGRSKIPAIVLGVCVVLAGVSAGTILAESAFGEEKETGSQETEAEVLIQISVEETEETTGVVETEPQETEPLQKEDEIIVWNTTWKYADFSVINGGTATLHYASSDIAKGKIVCVNAGHGTKGGSSVKTLCHPDGSPKVTSGSTAQGATKATAVAGGTTMNDGTPEAKVTLKLALKVREQLLADGFDVLMIRDSDDVQLDNIARTVMANENADCHIALHYDSTQSDKGAFYMSVPNVKSYKSMEPVASIWEEHDRLGESLIRGMREAGVKIFSSGSMAMDLTQTSYSTVPSVDLEVGDRASDYSEAQLRKLAKGIVDGVNIFFGQ